MAQRRLEISKLDFMFLYCKKREEKKRFIARIMKKYMKKYASNTDYKISSKLSKETESDSIVIVSVQFSKKMAISTVINILNNIIEQEIDCFIYDKCEEAATITIT